MTDYYPKTRADGNEIEKILETKFIDAFYALDVPRGRLADGKAKASDAAEYEKYRKEIDGYLKRLKTLFGL